MWNPVDPGVSPELHLPCLASKAEWHACRRLQDHDGEMRRLKLEFQAEDDAFVLDQGFVIGSVLV